MAAHRSSDKQAIGIVKTKYEEMKSVNLDVVSGERLAKLDDEVKMSWLMAKYRVMACHENSFTITNGRAGLQVYIQHG